jgi:molecular chaperone DnaJ
VDLTSDAKREVESRPHIVVNEGESMADKRDYYEVLGVEKSASQSDLKNAFRRLARKYHPDRSTENDAEERFKEIQEAYAVLSDDQKRAHYDRFGHDGPQGNPFGGFGGGFNINFDDILGGDFFSNLFGGGASRRRSRRGSDILLRHSINLEDVLNGTSQEVILDLPESCSSCDGTGAEGGDLVSCHRCSGSGQLRVRQQVGPFIQESVQPCDSCNGRGRVSDRPCHDCKGQGSELRSNTLRFNVPEGAETGTRLRMRGKGEPAPQGSGEPGDLFIELEVESHPWFERSGADLIMSLPLGYPELLLGTTVTLEHIDGKPLEIKVPSHSNSGETVEVKKRGLPRQRGNGRGDVVVLLKLYMPKKVSKGTKKSLNALESDLSPDDRISSILEDARERRSA